MNRERSYYRAMRRKHIKRKKRICQKYGFDWYSKDGQYSKGKIHCSCMMCTYGKRLKLPTWKDKQEKEIFLYELSNIN